MSRIPTEQECFEIMAEMNLHPGLVKHCIAVKNFALRAADDIEARGKQVNRPLVAAATLLHDIMKMDAQVCHGAEGGEFLRQKGFPQVASVVEKHCLSTLRHPSLMPETTEEKLLMYSDLRICAGDIVPLEERFAYIKSRYRFDDSALAKCFAFAKQIENDLFEEGTVAEDGVMIPVDDGVDQG